MTIDTVFWFPQRKNVAAGDMLAFGPSRPLFAYSRVPCEHDRSFKFVAIFTRFAVNLVVYRLSKTWDLGPEQGVSFAETASFEALGGLETRTIPGEISLGISANASTGGSVFLTTFVFVSVSMPFVLRRVFSSAPS